MCRLISEYISIFTGNLFQTISQYHSLHALCVHDSLYAGVMGLTASNACALSDSPCVIIFVEFSRHKFAIIPCPFQQGGKFFFKLVEIRQKMF
jgi:hypothetical protein